MSDQEIYRPETTMVIVVEDKLYEVQARYEQAKEELEQSLMQEDWKDTVLAELKKAHKEVQRSILKGLLVGNNDMTVPLGRYDQEQQMWTMIGSQADGIGRCKNCNQPIRWQACSTKKGIKNMPFNVQPVEISGRLFCIAHMQTCGQPTTDPSVDDTPF